jgi:magnesium chelatase subunit I
MSLFPFSAIVGLERARRSLLLHAVEPRLGGALLLGHRGCAKTTLARAFAELLPEGAPFVEVPLGATEDRLVGSVNASTLVESGRWLEQRGLIEQAHGGILYIDEINLLPDHLADFILDSAATGQHRVERDGITRQMQSRYVLVGSMNPEEGDLRPQLTDRFAHGVEIQDPFTPEERVEIARRRLAFDDDPDAFCRNFEGAQATLKRRVTEARFLLKQVQIGESERLSVAEQAQNLGMEGVRAELAVLRTARAAAAWDGRDEVNAADLDEAWVLCLAHRWTQNRSDSEPPKRPHHPSESSNPPGDAKYSPPRPKAQNAAPRSEAQAETTAQFPKQARPDFYPPVPEKAQPLEALKEWSRSARPRMHLKENSGRVSVSTRRHGSVAWVASLLASLANGWHSQHAAESGKKWRLRYRQGLKRPATWFFLDASRSTGLFLNAAKAALCEMVAATRGFRFHLLLLQGGEARWGLRNGSAPSTFRALNSVSHASGSSNLPVALKTLRRAQGRSQSGAADRQRTILVTDGLVTQQAGHSLPQALRQFRSELKKLSLNGTPLAWLHPPLSPANRALTGWLRRIFAGIRLKKIALSNLV